jgi:nucleotide-binding universal stress UspA family protein
MVVLGSRGRGRLTSRTLGSVSASVSRHAACPVVVCRPGTDLKVKHGVLVGADATPGSLRVVDFAFRQAALRGQPLTILHCHRDALAAVGGPRAGYEGGPDLEASRLALGESISGFREEYPDVSTTVQVAHGLATDNLATVADRHNLVVVGRHPVGSLARRMSAATATSVLERCHTAVAVVPEEGES